MCVFGRMDKYVAYIWLKREFRVYLDKDDQNVVKCTCLLIAESLSASYVGFASFMEDATESYCSLFS